MCGICGFIGDPEGIDSGSMLSALSHRGPDDTGEHGEEIPWGALWLGHKRLSILDLTSAGHQPMSYAGGRLWITFNGEIYNFRAVKRELEAHGYVFSTRTDTEVILAAWHKWGAASIGRFTGMFAFAIWDRDKSCLWLARDRLGEKPLYYTARPGRFLFASEVRSLLASGVVERKVDGDGLDSYLSFGSLCQPYTIVRNVRSLEAGRLLKVQRDQMEARTYWSLGTVAEDREEPAERVGKMVGLLTDSVRLCMVSDAPVGVLLSGGVDSTTILALLRRQGFEDLSSFTVVFDEHPAFSEDRWARKAADHFGTRHTRIPVSMRDAMDLLPKAVESMDQPSIDGAQTYIVSRAIAQSGIKVAISGLGSDELFFGYRFHRHFESLLALSKVRPLHPLLSLFLGMSGLPPLKDRLAPAAARARKLLDLYGTGSREAAAYLAWHSVFSHGEINRLRGGKRPFPARFIKYTPAASALGALSKLDLDNYMRNTLLCDADQMSMANSLELRVPFLDYRLVELVSSLPIDLRLGDGRYKQLLVDAVSHPLVFETAARPKSGFELPLGRWLRNGFRMGEIRPDLLGLDGKEIAGVMGRFRSGEKHTRYWSLLVLSSWLDRMGMSA
jgi:asparagine synthase (glutamine-hydrolysing)